jgi:hypothetical protein
MDAMDAEAVAKKKGASKAGQKQSGAVDGADADTLFARFYLVLTTLFALFDGETAGGATGKPLAAPKTRGGKKTPVTAETTAGQPDVPAGLSAEERAAWFAAFLAEKLQLTRKIREIAALRGVSRDEAEHAAGTALSVLLRSRSAKPASAAAIITCNLEKDDFRALLGVNLFDDVLWYNKEKFERTLHYAPLFLKAASPAASADIDKTVERIKSAEKKAVYKLAALAAAL